MSSALKADCIVCGKPAEVSSKYQKERFRKTGRAYCSPTCVDTYVRRESSARMSRTNRKYASIRMRRNNPMHRGDARQRMRETLLLMGHQPKMQGGNGRPPTEAEMVLGRMFSDEGFMLQCIVPTGMGRARGWPTHYKIDCGNPHLRIAIEADGRSHDCPSRREQDSRKDQLLTGLGWIVFRFSNREILEHPENVRATVMSTISRLRIYTLMLLTAA